MSWLPQALAVIAGLAGGWAMAHGVRRLTAALRDADDPGASLRLARGLRGVVVAVGLWSLAGGVFLEQTWLLVFGGVFLAEELYETGVLILVLRAQARTFDTSAAQRSSTGSTSSAFAGGRVNTTRATPASR
jgi:hypothetical protein